MNAVIGAVVVALLLAAVLGIGRLFDRIAPATATEGEEEPTGVWK